MVGGGDVEHVPALFFDQNRLGHKMGSGNGQMVVAENGRSPHPVGTQSHHIFESLLGQGGNLVEVEAHGVHTQAAEREAVDTCVQVHILAHFRIFSFAETHMVGSAFASDQFPVVLVIISQHVADLIVEIPVLQLGVVALDVGIAGSAVFEVAVLDVVLEFAFDELPL